MEPLKRYWPQVLFAISLAVWLIAHILAWPGRTWLGILLVGALWLLINRDAREGRSLVPYVAVGLAVGAAMGNPAFGVTYGLTFGLLCSGKKSVPPRACPARGPTSGG